ncbi:MAG: hypothetical protein BWY75_02640 [bacterium ADurb.Bin425]|nr:MAG: hypothetical protein BWY75_02640 [bacterium ADurb.Bin425]
MPVETSLEECISIKRRLCRNSLKALTISACTLKMARTLVLRKVSGRYCNSVSRLRFSILLFLLISTGGALFGRAKISNSSKTISSVGSCTSLPLMRTGVSASMVLLAAMISGRSLTSCQVLPWVRSLKKTSCPICLMVSI